MYINSKYRPDYDLMQAALYPLVYHVRCIHTSYTEGLATVQMYIYICIDHSNCTVVYLCRYPRECRGNLLRVGIAAALEQLILVATEVLPEVVEVVCVKEGAHEQETSSVTIQPQTACKTTFHNTKKKKKQQNKQKTTTKPNNNNSNKKQKQQNTQVIHVFLHQEWAKLDVCRYRYSVF